MDDFTHKERKQIKNETVFVYAFRIIDKIE